MREYIIGNVAIEIVEGIIVKVNDNIIDLKGLEGNILNFMLNR